MNFILVKLISITHVLAIIYLVFGWLLPQEYLIYHLVFVPLTILQWWVNNNQCILTQVQAQLEGKKLKEGAQGEFVKGLLQKFGLNPSDQQLFYIIYGLMFLSFLLSLGRLACSGKI